MELTCVERSNLVFDRVVIIRFAGENLASRVRARRKGGSRGASFDKLRTSFRAPDLSAGVST